ncbi:hypothetical protein ACLBKS_14480 [Hylemonella sp. W303a]|uniref:hypothetical protein n=1 Tax=Hylemonella sp. W303a TaxID=3389873 RepID=UPI00396B14DA
MKLIELLIPLLGVLLGAAITGAGSVWKDRQARKRSIARALSELLEVRHQMNAIDLVIRELRRHVSLPAEFSIVLGNMLKEIFPIDPDIHKRYNDSISSLAEVDPVLAFQLRSKDRILDLQSLPMKLTTQSQLPASEAAQLENALHQLVLPHLDWAVLELASAHSLRTKHRVKIFFDENKHPPPEIVRWIEEQVKKAEKRLDN